MTIIKDLTCTKSQITHFTIRVGINIRANTSNLSLLQHNNLNYADFTKMTLEVQNYHFAPNGNILGLILKITIGLYLHGFSKYAIYMTI